MHYGCRITIFFFLQILKVRDSTVECILSKLAGVVWRSEDFVIEHGIVESKSKSDWMGGLQFFSLILRLLIGVLGIIDNPLSLISCQKFSKVPEIVTLHLQEKHNGFWMLWVGNQMIIKQWYHVVTNCLKFVLDFLLILNNQLEEFASLQKWIHYE